MKLATLLLVTITQIFNVFSAENVTFRDGTSLNASMFKGKGFEPDKNGVILTVDNKIYVHHFPRTGRNLAPSKYYLAHCPNPYNMPNCVPTRLSFFNFESFTLLKMRENIIKMPIPYNKKLEAVRAIDVAMTNNPPKLLTAEYLTTNRVIRKWENTCLIRFAYAFEKGVAVWGKDLESLKENDSVNNRRVFAEK